MTGPSDRVVVCYQCGASNPADDQFCGNCGVFLEWSAEPAAAGTPAAGPPAARGTEIPAPAPTATEAASPVPSSDLVRCPTCGTANVAGRTFCQRCGNKLAGATAATRLPLPPRAEPSTRVRAADAPVSAPERAPEKVRRRQPEKEGRGLSSWLLLGGAGIAVGAIVVAAALVLGSGKPPPPAAASSAPSASVSASHRPSASAAPSKAVKTAKPRASK